ncbi:MAG: hypothetical protein KAW09_11085 [Thermoplasmata archaeon]|nr:hypothetical protein [Thermoplasmata archaeon]
MEKVIGLLTKDFRLYHDLVKALKRRDLGFMSLSFEDSIPPNVGVVITSREEVDKVDFERKVACEDIGKAIAESIRVLKGKERFEELIIGIDPGAKPGIAVVGDGTVLETKGANSPEEVAELIREIVESYPADFVGLRIGHGDPTNRNRIINSLSSQRFDIEIVDEKGTTPRSDTPDQEAAIGIAFIRGHPAKRKYRISPSPGEIKDLQTRSRVQSRGKMTISRSLAVRVAKGEMTLDEAIEKQGNTGN